MSFPPLDLHRAHVEAIVAHRHTDIPIGANQILVLTDVEFHSNNPRLQPEVVRKVNRFPDPIGRTPLLQVLGLASYCQRLRLPCLVWCNGEIIPPDVTHIHFHDGDYLRIALPPGNGCVDHVNTRCLASALYQGLAIEDILDRQAMFQLGWYDTMIGPPFVPVCPEDQDSDTMSLLQLHSIKTPPLDDTPPFLSTTTSNIWGQCPSDRLEEEPEYRRTDGPTFEQPIGTVLNPLQGMPPAIQELFMLWLHIAHTREQGPDTIIPVETWYLAGPHYLTCRESRTVYLGGNFQTWLQQLIEEWHDRLNRGAGIQLHIVRPMPRLTVGRPETRPHVILTQTVPELVLANLYTVVDSAGTTVQATQYAIFGGFQQTWWSVVHGAGIAQSCPLPQSATQCMVWHGEMQLRDPIALRNRHGYEFTVIINPVTAYSQVPLNTWPEDADDMVMLQTKASKTTLSLDNLIPPTVAVRVHGLPGSAKLPTYLEIPAPGGELQVAQELQNWGHNCTAFHCGLEGVFFCIDMNRATSSQYHYVLCHDDPHDQEGVFLHTAEKEMTEIQLMTHLCSLGYTRAVVLHKTSLMKDWIRIIFHHREPQMTIEAPCTKARTPWPIRGSAKRTSQPLMRIDLEAVHTNEAECKLHTSFGRRDLQELFQSGFDVLCTDFDCIELPPEIRNEIQRYNIVPIRSAADLDQFDRILIFTDGTSIPGLRRWTPQQADECGHPDCWSMLVLGEIFMNDQDSEIALLGWTAHPVRYDPLGQAYFGIDSIGSDMAERAALIGAGAWRLSINHAVTTVICTDSLTGGNQAFGLMGSHKEDASFQLLRGIYQALEIALGTSNLILHHVRSHTGDVFNEFADLVVKLEAKNSMNLPRQKLDMNSWMEHFKQLWVAFQTDHGIPLWQQGYLHVPAPALPADGDPDHDQHWPQAVPRTIAFAFSLATANVQALYRASDGHAGKLHYLQEQMRFFKFNCIALQEARSDPGLFTNANILRLCSGHQQGFFGIELWIDLEQPFAHDDRGHGFFFTASQFQTVHGDPRRLLVRCDADIWSFWIFAFHAPHSGHSLQDREAWWTETMRILDINLDSDPLFVLADANAAPGCYDGQTVLSEGFATTPNTTAFRSLLQTHRLFLPATSHIHTGTNFTWTHCTGDSQHCIDHVAVPQEWKERCTHSQVVHEFDLATPNEDHHLVALQMQWSSITAVPTERHGRGHGKKATKYVHTSNLHPKLLQMPPQSWLEDVDTQHAALTSHLHNVLKENTLTSFESCKKLYVDEQAWTMRTDKIAIEKKIKETTIQLKKELLQRCFNGWKSTLSETLIQDDHSIAYERSLRCIRLSLVAKLRLIGHHLKQRLIKAKQKALTEQLLQLPEAASASDILRRLKPFIGPTNPKKAKRKALPLLQNPQGQTCVLPNEALEVWINFFQDMEAGTRMTYGELRQTWINELLELQQQQLQAALETLPSLTDLEGALRRVPKGKAIGPDGLPGELCHHQPAALARLLYPCLLKTMLHGHEPLAFKGGVLVPVYKGKGPMDSCSSFRSILISNHLGKAIHRSIRQSTASVYEAFLHKQQTGGRRGIPVQLAQHQTRAFCRAATAQGRSTGVLFVDLTEAFYRVLREAPLGGPVTDELLAHLMKKLHMPEDSLHDIHALLSEQPAIAQAGLDDIHQRCFRAIHQSTHFWMRGQRDVSRTTMGTRPGDSFADIVFGYMWRTVLVKLEEHLIATEVIRPLEAQHQLPLFGHDFRTGHDSFFIGPTWMDDLAVCVEVPRAEQLPTTMMHVTSYLLDLCSFHCLSPNLSPGKTELLLSFRGVNSRKMRTTHFGPNSSKTLPIVCEKETKHIRLVSHYKHLGGLCHHSSDQRAELRQRQAAAQQALSRHRRLVYHNKEIEQAKRMELFQTLVMTKLLYGAESWLALDAKTQQRFHAHVISLYKRLAKLPQDGHFSDDEVLVTVHMLSPTELLRRARLRYLGTLIRAGLPDAWTVLSLDSEWRTLLEEDMIWMWDQLKRASDLGDPRSHYPQWLLLMQMHPGHWKRLIRRACEHCMMQRQKRVQVRQLHSEALSAMWRLFPQDMKPEMPKQEQQGAFGCMHCQMSFRSHAGEEAHMFKVHTQASHLRALSDHPSCPACLKFFHTMQKLKAHLHYADRCREVLQSRNLLCPVIPGAGSTEDAERTRQHDRLLPPLRGMGPHPQVVRGRHYLNVDGELHDILVDTLLDYPDKQPFVTQIAEIATARAISWTRFKRTILFFADTLSPADGTALGFDFEEIKKALQDLAEASAWAFLQTPVDRQKGPHDIAELEHQCHQLHHLLRQWTPEIVPKQFGRQRVLLHLFSGRRRRGDIQFYLDALSAAQSDFALFVISLDIIIDSDYGDATKKETCAFWLDAIRGGLVIAMLAGPPCESWSHARSIQSPQSADVTEVVNTRGPRVLRDLDNLWGFNSVRLKEIMQICVGNALLGFALLAFLELALIDGIGLIEHPAPADDPSAASIWRLPLVQAISELPQVSLLRFCQGLLGAKSPKPTTLMLLNQPQLLTCLHEHRIRMENPRAATFGKDHLGRWNTAALKEYPPALCKSISKSLFDAIASRPVSNSAVELPYEFMQTCKSMNLTSYGETLGADFAR